MAGTDFQHSPNFGLAYLNMGFGNLGHSEKYGDCREENFEVETD